MLSIITIKDKKLLPSLMAMYEKGKQLLKFHGSGQWQNGEPSELTITQDIEVGNLIGLFKENVLVGACARMKHDPHYDHLLEGSWLNDDPYVVLHRFVIDSPFHNQGLGGHFLTLLEEDSKNHQLFNMKIDTHEFNLPMKALLVKMKYIPIGKVFLPSIGERIVYHKILR